MHLHVHNSIIHSGLNMETTKVSSDRWVDKEDVVHINNGMLLSHNERWNIAICNNMDGLWKYCGKWNKSVRES